MAAIEEERSEESARDYKLRPPLTPYYAYQVDHNWGRTRPRELSVGVISGVATDSSDRVYFVDREPHPAILVFSIDGTFLDRWGDQLFTLPHSIFITPDDRLFITDCGDHTVKVCSVDGRLIETHGTAGQTGSDGQPFNMPTKAVVALWGDIYVSDGYGQHYIHRFSSDWQLISTWGGRGPEPGQFSLPHGIATDGQGRVYVADREPNNRIQVFDADGGFLTQWVDLGYPCDIAIDNEGVIFVGEGGGARMSQFDRQGNLLGGFGSYGLNPGEFQFGPHALALDSTGAVYMAEVGGPDQITKLSRRSQS